MRVTRYPVINPIKMRWSPRAFSDEKIPRKTIDTLIEAARFAPSAFNAQPWRFIVPQNEREQTLIKNALLPGNQIWALRAPVVIIIAAKMRFEDRDKDNHYALFDTGCAWGMLAIQASSMGLETHAMAGVDKKRVHEDFQLAEDEKVICAVAIGYYGHRQQLPPNLQEREEPNVRKSMSDIILNK